MAPSLPVLPIRAPNPRRSAPAVPRPPQPARGRRRRRSPKTPCAFKAGAELPDFAVRGADGAEKRISAYRGKPLVLSFSPAESIPNDWLDQAVANYGPHGVEVLALVTRDTPENYRAWLELHRDRHRFATALDPAGPTAIKESAVFLAVGMVVPMPMVLVLDRDGKLVGKVAPKVATSPQGLAELLRRTGVPVKAADLPTPEMMALAAKFAAAAAPAPAAPFPASEPVPRAAATPGVPRRSRLRRLRGAPQRATAGQAPRNGRHGKILRLGRRPRPSDHRRRTEVLQKLSPGSAALGRGDDRGQPCADLYEKASRPNRARKTRASPT